MNHAGMSLDGVEASAMGSVDPSKYSNVNVLPAVSLKTDPSMFIINEPLALV